MAPGADTGGPNVKVTKGHLSTSRVCHPIDPDQESLRTRRFGFCLRYFLRRVHLNMGRNGKSDQNELQVRRVVDVPLREVSGICLRRSRNGRMSLIAVGDRIAKIAWFSHSRSDAADRLEYDEHCEALGFGAS